jgi:hypothetical protein
MLRLFCCENWQIVVPNVVSWRVTVVVDVHILGLPLVGHPADTSAAVEDWCSNVVLVELMDDGDDTIFTTYLSPLEIVERAEVVHRGRVRRLLLVDVLSVI